MSNNQNESSATRQLVAQAAAGDQKAYNQLFEQERADLIRFIEHRMDGRLKRRFDASDVIQETYVESLERFSDYVDRDPMPFGLWVRKNALERFLKLRRSHLEAQKRSVAKEAAEPDQSSASLSHYMVSSIPTPSEQALRTERAAAVSAAIESLPDNDREILVLRHIEDYSYRQIACILGLEEATCRKRYGRALLKLQNVLTN